MEFALVRAQDLIVIVTSAGTEEQALDIAHAVIRSRQAACVNLLPNVHSIYRWKGRICDDGEFLLLIKTQAKQFDAVRETIHRVNTYELPEVLAYRVDDASPGFASWISKMTEPSKRRAARGPRPVPAVRRSNGASGRRGRSELQAG
jgi:periplasmic divalent cation tolerance protein